MAAARAKHPPETPGNDGRLALLEAIRSAAGGRTLRRTPAPSKQRAQSKATREGDQTGKNDRAKITGDPQTDLMAALAQALQLRRQGLLARASAKRKSQSSSDAAEDGQRRVLAVNQQRGVESDSSAGRDTDDDDDDWH